MGPSLGNWLAAQGADLTFGKTVICIFVTVGIKNCLAQGHNKMTLLRIELRAS